MSATGPELDRLRATLPSGIRVEAITPSIRERCAWRDLVVDAHGESDLSSGSVTALF